MTTVTLEYIARRLEIGFSELREDIRMLRAAVNDIARESVTPGEIAAMHHDITRVMAKQDDLAARVEALETAK